VMLAASFVRLGTEPAHPQPCIRPGYAWNARFGLPGLVA